MTYQTDRLKRAVALAGLLLVAGAAGLAPATAQARVFVNFGFPFVAFPPPVVYAPPPVAYYRPPPAAYYPPPVAYAAPVVVAAPVPVYGGFGFFGGRRFR